MFMRGFFCYFLFCTLISGFGISKAGPINELVSVSPLLLLGRNCIELVLCLCYILGRIPQCETM